MTEQIDAWAGRSLTYAGRAELIRSVLQGIECFWLSILPAPEGVIQRVTSLCRNFLWGGTKEACKQALVSWKNLCLPKSEGGLGFKCLRTWNKALLSKNLWNIQAKQDSLWVKWTHQNYFKDETIWEYHGKKGDSFLVRQLIAIKNEIWNREGSKEAAQLRIASWASLGQIDVSKAYEFFRLTGQRNRWSKVLWTDCSMPKHSFVMWLAMKEKLRTKDKVPGEDRLCVLCKAEEETLGHLFFCCTFVKQIWGSIKGWLKITRRLSTLKAAVKWLIKEVRGTGVYSKAKRVAVAAVVYTIWEERNMLIHEGKKRSPAAIVKKIQVQVYIALSHLRPIGF